MSQLDIIYTIIIVICLIATSSNGIVALIRFIKSKKYDDTEYKTRCKMLAQMLKAGIQVPTEFVVKVLEGRVSNDTFAATITELKLDHKKTKTCLEKKQGKF